MDAHLQSDTRLKPLSLTQLVLTNFRSYERLVLDTDAPSVVITGHNGAGKTNILEAISLLIPGRGMRGAALSAYDRVGGVSVDDAFSGFPWSIAANIQCGGDAIKIATGRLPQSGVQEKRVVKIDGEEQRSQQALGEHMALWYLTPQMDTLFLDGQAARREYFDKVVGLFDLDHVRHLAVYDRTRYERLQLLQRAYPDEAWLAVLEQRLAEYATRIATARVQVEEQLQQAIKADETPFPRAICRLAGMAEDAVRSMPAVQVEQMLYEAFAAHRSQDARNGKTAIGTQRSEWHITHSNRQMPAELCSTGEQKALLLSLTLAVIRAKASWSKRVPLLLLDEVVAHLDEEKRALLMTAVEQLGAQCWMTGTDASFFAGFQGKSQFFTIENSRIVG
ncbi:MAG: DNA replication/repair protein RecF [Alphaproteobacteria bacterium]|nr:DNA replication/repair protein RecF [Alphaproteobacteria bacterium]